MTDILEYVMVENIMSKELCREMINMTSKGDWEKHTWSHNDYHNITFSNDTAELDIQNSTVEMQELLNPSIRKKIEIYSEKFRSKGEMMGNIIGKFTSPRINRYKVGTRIRRHYDHIHSVFADKEGIPVLSIAGVFNDDYEGGKFIVRDKEFILKQGDIITMPSVFLYPHEVTEITKGIRYSFISWGF